MEDWGITCRRYVGYIDIMGFKDLVLRSSHQKVYEIMIKIDECKTFNENIKWPKLEGKFVYTTTYSDSIMIFSKDDSLDSLRAFNGTISGMIEDLFAEKIPFKGAIAFGNMTLDLKRSIFFGQPLIDSFLLQEELYFYGIIVHASAEKEMFRRRTNIEKLFFTKYLCPLKNGSCYHLTIHPMSADPVGDIKNYEKEYRELLCSVDRLRQSTSVYLRRYVDNTEQYLKYVWGSNSK
jgi:hypothetical protein